MEGMRGFACLLVFAVHYSNSFAAWAVPGSFAARCAAGASIFGHAGVDLFFSLSGYLVYGMAMRHMGSVVAFIRRRLRRIYPAFIGALSVYLVLFAIFPGRAKWPQSGRLLYVLENLLLLPGVFDLEPAVTVAWSLSYELLFYLSVPFLVRILRLPSWRRNARMALIASLSLGYVVLAMLLFPGKVPGIPLFLWSHSRLLLFASGMLAWEVGGAAGVGTNARIRFDTAAFAVLILALGATLPLANPAYQQPWPDLTRAMILGGACFLLSLAAYHGSGRVARFFSLDGLRWLGNCSYSFYLMHSLGIHAAAMLSATLLPADVWRGYVFWLLLPLALAGAIAATLPLYLFVERPFSLRPSAIPVKGE